MIYVSLVFLFVYLFGAYAYGAVTVLSFGKDKSLWGMDKNYPPEIRTKIDRAALAIFLISTAWFLLHVLIEFRHLTGDTGRGFLDLFVFMAFLFPPVIMTTVYLEAHVEGGTPPSPIYSILLRAMYVISPGIGILLILSILRVLPRPGWIAPMIGLAIGAMFMLASAYSVALMTRKPPRTQTRSQRRMRTVMVSLFLSMIGLFFVLMFMREDALFVEVLDRTSRATPLLFMIASVYYEDRVAFYDLVVKRALMLLASVLMFGLFLMLVLPWLYRLPEGDARPWLVALALAPIALLMRRVYEKAERWLDRRWFGREFTPVDAVKHVLAAMQPATDEQTLIDAAEQRLGEIFGAKIMVMVGSRAILEPALQAEVKLTSPVTGSIIRIAVLREERTRRLLSEDVALLRSLGSVFGFMLENIRLQRQRVEQEQLAQDLRLQSSKSELKALRAQINPHFLFNALNAIASLIHTDPGRADEAVEQLAEVFRYTLRRSDSEWAPLDQELTFAKAYLDVEHARFGERLTATIDSTIAQASMPVPSMLLQTLLENAVKHGVSQERGPGRIVVVVRAAADTITIEVRNTGPAPTAARRRDGEGFGLHSVRERLKGHFGDRASFTLDRDDAAGMTIARIVMPQAKVVS